MSGTWFHGIDGGCDWSDIGGGVPVLLMRDSRLSTRKKGADGDHGACGAWVVGEVGGGYQWHAIIRAAAN